MPAAIWFSSWLALRSGVRFQINPPCEFIACSASDELTEGCPGGKCALSSSCPLAGSRINSALRSAAGMLADEPFDGALKHAIERSVGAEFHH